MILGSGALIGTALPAHAFEVATCSSTMTLSTAVFGFQCSNVGDMPQSGAISGPAHTYSCGIVERSPLIGDVTGNECTELP